MYSSKSIDMRLPTSVPDPCRKVWNRGPERVTQWGLFLRRGVHFLISTGLLLDLLYNVFGFFRRLAMDGKEMLGQTSQAHACSDDDIPT